VRGGVVYYTCTSDVKEGVPPLSIRSIFWNSWLVGVSISVHLADASSIAEYCLYMNIRGKWDVFGLS
jgi:hypothetical protein